MSVNEQSAITGGRPEFSSELPPYNTIGEQEIEAALSVLKTGVLSGFVANPGPDFLGGDVVISLEQAFCKRFGSAYAVSVNSATSGLHAALAAAEVGAGDEVIVPPYSMAASATAAVMCGAKPIFVDIEADTFCLDPARVVDALTTHTKAIMAVNIFGQPANLSELRAIADEHGLILVEDNAQAPAAEHHGQWAGSIGDMGVFSLNRHKTMQCGEGGVVICNDAALAHKLRMVRNHGEAVLPEWTADQHQPGDESIIGYNYRLTSLQAAIALPQLQRLDELNRHRIELADYLSDRLSGFDFLQTPVIRDGCSHVYYLYPMIFDAGKAGMSRDRFVDAMRAEGAPVANYVRPLYRLPLYRTRFGDSDCYNPENFPVVEKLWQESMVVTSICRPPLDTGHIDHFVSAIQKISQNRQIIADLSAT